MIVPVAHFRLPIEPGRRARPIGNRQLAVGNGFTLIELVTALLMVAVLAGSIYASLRIAFRAQASAEAAVEPARTADVAMELLRTDIQNAMPPTGDLAIGFLGTNNFDARGDKLEFYSTAESRKHEAGYGDIKKIELQISPTNVNEVVLVRRVTPNLLAQQTPEPDEEVICRGVGAFNLRYYDGAGWVDEWDSTSTIIPLPLAVEVTIQLDRPQANGETLSKKYVRVFPIACATAADEDEEALP